MTAVIAALLLGTAIGLVLAALIGAEVLLRLLPRLELHGLRPVLALLRHDVLRLHRPDERTLRRRIARALRAERTTLPSSRTYAARSIVVWVSGADLQLLAARVPVELLQEELALFYADVADRQGWIRSGGETVVLHARADLARGAFDVQSRIGQVVRASETPVRTVPSGAASAPDADEILTERMAPESCSATLTYRGRTQTLFADEPPVRIGRAPDATFRLEEEGVSREHAVLDHREGVWWLRPSPDARNGTFVDGVRIGGPVVLRGRRFIRLGQRGAAEFASDCAHPEHR